MQPIPTYLMRHALAGAHARRRRHRPLGVVLIAFYGFACAVLLGFGLWQDSQFNQFHPDFGQNRLLAHFDDILIAVPFSIVIHILLSVELLMCRQGARLGRMALSAANLVIYLHYRSFLFQEMPSQIDLAGHAVLAILLVDFLILLYLAFSPEAIHAFRTGIEKTD